MQIKDYDTPLPHICLSNEHGGSHSRTLSLYTYKPAIGVCGENYIPLDESLHLAQWTTKLTTNAVDSSNLSITAERQEVLILNSSIHNDKPSDAKFMLPFSGFNLGRTIWKAPSSYFGEVKYSSNYREWAEDIISRHEAVLAEAGVLYSIHASRFSYDRCDSVLRAFCKYWCPSTNTLHTPIGELSISLWDLHRLGGLPIRGMFYDEVVPSAKELLDVDSKGKSLLPRSCRHLFVAYYKLGKENHGKVSLKSWVQFWFRDDSKYGTPPTQEHRRNVDARPKRTSNSSGSFHLTETKDDIPFDILRIPNSLRNETFIAAFLTCWICKFLLPSAEVDSVRPSVFKVASLMATGIKFSLAIPVLTSIYDGLRKIVQAPNLRECTAIFPIHYVYGWIGQYFDAYQLNTHIDSCVARHAKMTRFSGEGMARLFITLAAEELFKSVTPRSLSKLCWVEKENKIFTDDGSSPPSHTEYFISQRSCYLTLHQNNIFLVEHYSPCRFSRQFGFCQAIPYCLKEITHTYTLGETLQLWESSIRVQIKSMMIIPSETRLSLVTQDYNTWWIKRSTDICKTIIKSTANRRKDDEPQDSIEGTSSSSKKSKTIAANELKPGDRVSSESSNQDRPWNRPKKKSKSSGLEDVSIDLSFFADTPSSNMSPRLAQHLSALERPREADDNLLDNQDSASLGKPSSDHERAQKPCVPISEFHGCNVIKAHQRKYVQELWNELSRDISNTPLEFISSLEKYAGDVIEEIAKVDSAIAPSLQDTLKDLFARAKDYDSSRSSAAEKMTREAYEKNHSRASAHLSETKAKEEEATKHLQTLEEKRQSFEDRRKTLQKELDDLEKQITKVNSTIDQNHKTLKQIQAEVSKAHEEVTSIESISFLSDEDVKEIERTRALLDARRTVTADYRP